STASSNSRATPSAGASAAMRFPNRPPRRPLRNRRPRPEPPRDLAKRSDPCKECFPCGGCFYLCRPVCSVYFKTCPCGSKRREMSKTGVALVSANDVMRPPPVFAHGDVYVGRPRFQNVAERAFVEDVVDDLVLGPVGPLAQRN